MKGQSKLWSILIPIFFLLSLAGSFSDQVRHSFSAADEMGSGWTLVDLESMFGAPNETQENDSGSQIVPIDEISNSSGELFPLVPGSGSNAPPPDSTQEGYNATASGETWDIVPIEQVPIGNESAANETLDEKDKDKEQKKGACERLGLENAYCSEKEETILIQDLENTEISLGTVFLGYTEVTETKDRIEIKAVNTKLLLKNISDVKIKDAVFKGDEGSILFKELSINSVKEQKEISSAVTISKNNIGIDTIATPELDQPAQIEFYNIYGMNNAYPLRNGEPCGTFCSNFTYDANTGIASMEVSGFSNYSIGEINVSIVEHLASDYSFISNITAEVYYLDGNWSEQIPVGDFVRATFESNLTNGRIMDIYLRAGGGNASFNVYSAGTTSPPVGSSGYFQPSGDWVYIGVQNLTEPTLTFDFEVVGEPGAYLEFDFIHDVAGIANVSLDSTPSGQNLPSDNLTVSYDLYSNFDNAAISWTLNGANLLTLNMPFDGASNSTWAEDLSGNNNDAVMYMPNVALGKTAVQKSTYSASNPASNAVDGNTSSYQHTTNNTATEWWKVDLGQEYRIDKIHLVKRAGWGTRPANYNVQTSTDNFVSNAVTIVSKTSETSTDITFGSSDFSPVTTRYLRVIDTKSTYPYEYLNIAEFEVYGHPSASGHDSTGTYECEASIDVYAKISNEAMDGLDDFTIMMWAYKKSATTAMEAFFSAANTTQYNQFVLFANGTAMQVYVEGTYDQFNGFNIGQNAWHHVAFKRTGTTGEMFLDGTSLGTATVLGNPLTVGCAGADGIITCQEQDSCAGTFSATQALEGYLDDILIFNRSLSDEEIAAIAGGNPERMVSQETVEGDNWRACLYPTNETTTGDQVCSNYLTIAGNLSGCKAIYSPGIYELSSDLTGAPTPVPDISWLPNACLLLLSDDIELDCKGHTITNSGVASAAGIIAGNSSGFTNITIKNCNISSYNISVASWFVAYGVIQNVTSHDSYVGTFLNHSSYINLSNNSAYLQSGHAFAAERSDHLRFEDNTAYSNGGSGFGFSGGSDNTLIGNSAYGNSNSGIHIALETGDSLQFNNLTGNQYGIRFQDADSGDCTNNTANGNANYGIYLQTGSDGNDLFNNTVQYNGAYGVYISADSNSNPMLDNQFCYNNHTSYDVYDLDTNPHSGNSCGPWRRYNSSIGGANHCDISTCPCFGISAPGTYTLTSSMDGDLSAVSGVSYITKSCVAISTDNVTLDCKGYNITNSGATLDAAGILISGAEGSERKNVTVKNCRNVSGFEINAYLYYADNNTLQNVTSELAMSSGYNLYLHYSDNNTIRDSTFQSPLGTINVYAYASTTPTTTTRNNLFVNNTIYFPTTYGLYMSAANNTIHNNSFVGTVAGTTRALYPISSDNNYSNNIFSGTYGYGVYAPSAYSGNNFVNNSFSGAYSYGFYTSGAFNNNNFINNSVTGAYSRGFYIYNGASGNLFENNTVIGATLYGFYLTRNVNNNRLVHNEVVNSTSIGLYLAGYNTSGVFETCSNNTLTNNTVSGGYSGIYLYRVNDTHLYDNAVYRTTYDFRVSDVGPLVELVYDMHNTFFLPDSGVFENYTNLSAQDTISPGEYYAISWDSDPSPGSPPANRFPFRNKFVDILTLSGTPSIDEITWHWLNSEITGDYDESLFEVWKYSGGWGANALNNTPDTGNNQLKLYNVNPASEYGIFQSNQTVCGIINESGTYALTNNVLGAPIATGLGSAPSACIVITSDNVSLSCNGYNITNNGTSFASGILINGSSGSELTNITIRDCPKIDDYYVGVYPRFMDYSFLRNLTLENNTVGISPAQSDHNDFSNISAYNGTLGLYLNRVTFTNMTNLDAHNNTNGVYIYQLSSDIILSYSRIYNNTDSGLMINLDCNALNITGNNISENGGHGIYMNDSYGNDFYSNLVHDNGMNGLYVEDCAPGAAFPNRFFGDRFYNNSYSGANATGSAYVQFFSADFMDNGIDGAYLEDTDNFTIALRPASDPSTVSGNTRNGIYADTCSVFTIYGFDPMAGSSGTMRIYDNGGDGISLLDSSNGNLGYATNMGLHIYDNLKSGLRVKGSAIPNSYHKASMLNLTNNLEGISLDTANFNNLTNCLVSTSNTGYGVYMIASDNNKFAGNTVYNSALGGIWVRNSDHNTFDNDTVYESGRDGVSLTTGAVNNTFTNLTSHHNDWNGLYIDSIAAASSTKNKFVRSGFHNNTYSGANVTGSSYVLFWSSDFSDNTRDGAYVYNSDNFELSLYPHTDPMYAEGNGDNGINVVSSDTFIIEPFDGVMGNAGTAYARDNGDWGIRLYASTSGTVGHTASNFYINGNTESGVRAGTSSYINITNITAYGSNHGVNVVSSQHINILESTLHSNSLTGAYLENAYNSTVESNYLYGNAVFGIGIISTSVDNNITENHVSGSQYGINLWDNSHNSRVVGNEMHGNTLYGFYSQNSNNAYLANNTFYNNSLDFFTGKPAASAAYPFEMHNSLFLNPAGTLENYTNLTVIDSLITNNAYTINWTGVSYSLPANKFSFRQKYVNISDAGSVASWIDRATWHWNDAEATGIYIESRFELWRHNASAGWTMLNNSPDTGANTLSAYVFTPASDYGILEDNSTVCGIINESGTYTLGNNLTGATIPVATAGLSAACIVVNADNVIVDCNGHSITNDGTATAGGIFLNGTSGDYVENVTLKNCRNISGYYFGAQLWYANQSRVENVNFTNSSGAGLVIRRSGYDNATNISATNSTMGIYLAKADYNIFNTIRAYNNSVGFYLYDSSEGNEIYDSSSHNNTQYGLALNENSDGNLIRSFNATNNGLDGIWLNHSMSNQIQSSLSANNTGNGLSIPFSDGVAGNLFFNSEFLDNGNSGANVTNSIYTYFQACNFSYNSLDGAYVNNSQYTSITTDPLKDSSASFNGRDGLHFDNSDTITISASYASTSLRLHNNTNNGLALYSSRYATASTVATGTISAYGNGADGVNIQKGVIGTTNHVFTSFKSYNNTGSGFYMDGVASNNFTYCRADDNNNGFYIIESNSNLLKYNNASYNGANGLFINLSSDTNYFLGSVITYNDLNGIYLSGSSNNTFENNSVDHNTGNGLYMAATPSSSALSNNFYGDTFEANQQSGANISASRHFNFYGPQFVSNTLDGAYVSGSDNFKLYPWIPVSLALNANGNFGSGIRISNSTLFSILPTKDGSSEAVYFNDNSLKGLYLYNSTFGTIGSAGAIGYVKIYGNGEEGIAVENPSPYSSHHSFMGIYSYENAAGGASVSSSDANNFTRCIFYKNPASGFAVSDSGSTRLNQTRFYNNTRDFSISNSLGSGIRMYMYNSIFSEPGGTLANYTNLSMYDLAAASSSYSMNWSSVPPSLPSNRLDFRGKYLNITELSGTVAIDDITWHWDTSELPGYNENFFELWRYRGTTWTLLNDTPDTANNKIINYSLTPDADVYALLQNNASECMEITVPGTYVLKNNLYGSPITFSPALDTVQLACIAISTSNVTLDCGGYNITALPSVGSAGIAVNGSDANPRSNITIQNCPRVYGGLAAGILSYNSTRVLVQNSTATGNNVNIYFYNSTSSNITNSNATYSSGTHGIRLYLGGNNRIISSGAYGNIIGMNITRSNSTRISSPVLYNNTIALTVSDVGADAMHPADFDMDNGYFYSADLHDYANITMHDVVSSGVSYSINWTPTRPLPTGFYEFHDKSANITRLSGTVSIDQISFSWSASEAAGYDESRLRLWRYSTGWAELNDTPDTSNNRLTLYNMNPASDYDIIYTNITACFVANASNAKYEVAGNLVGAPNTAYPLGNKACIVVAAVNVTIDCYGYNITNDGSTAAYGIFVNATSSNVTLENCPRVSGYDGGAVPYDTSQGILRNSSFSNNTYGIYVYSTTYYAIENTSAYNATFAIYLEDSGYINITNSRFFREEYGAYVDTSAAVLVNNTFYNSSKYDLYAYNPAAAPQILNMSNSIFQSPSGTLLNYTNLSVYDSVSSEAYSFNWTTNSTAIPALATSFRNKYIAIRNHTASATISLVTWHWDDSELAGYDENSFTLWKSPPTTWNPVSTSVSDPANNRIYVADLNPASDYGIFEAAFYKNTCFDANISGATYELMDNLAGAPISASPIPGAVACIKVSAPSVTINCNGYNVTGNGTANAYGIVVNETGGGSFVYNCTVRNYSLSGAIVFHSWGSTFRNMEFYNNSVNGLAVWYNSDENIFENITSYNHLAGAGISLIGTGDSLWPNRNLINNSRSYNNQYGIYAYKASSNNFTNTLVYNNTYGAHATTSNNLVFRNTTFTNHSSLGLYATDSERCSILNSSFTNSTGYGIVLSDASDEGTINNVTVTGGLIAVFINYTDSTYGNNLSINPSTGGTSYGLFLDHADFNNFTDMLIRNATRGAYLDFSNNNSINDTLAYNYSYGIYLYHAENNTVWHTTTRNGYIDGIRIDESSLNWVENSTSYNNSWNGVTIKAFAASGESVGNVVRNTTAYNNSRSGFLTIRSILNYFNNITAYNNSWNGFYLDYADNNTITIANFTDNPTGVLYDHSLYNTMTQTNVYEGSISMYINYSSSNDFGYMDLYSPTTFGLYSLESDLNNYIEVDLNGSLYGLYLDHSENNDVNYSDVSGTTNYGLALIYSPGTDILSLNTTGADYGLGISYSNNTFVLLSDMRNADIIGALMDHSDRLSFYYTLFHGSEYGAASDRCNDITFYGSRVYDNAGYGIYFLDSGITSYATGTHVNLTTFYNNSYAIVSNNTDQRTYHQIEFSDFRNENASDENHTRFYMNDSFLETSRAYGINWSAQPADPPPFYESFRYKYLRITNLTGVGMELEYAGFAWTEAELGGYDEDKFVLQSYVFATNTWIDMNATLDTVGNQLSVINLSVTAPLGNRVYGIHQFNGSECMEINESGEYTLNHNIEGAPIAVTEGADVAWACIKIKTHNVLFDCNGYNITNNGTGNAAGIISVPYLLLPIDKNVTIMNCPGVSGYESGIYVFDRYHAVYNSTSFNNTQNGFYIHLNATNTTLENDTAYDNGNNGFHIKDTGNISITNCTAYNSTQGFRIMNSTHNTLTNNTAYNTTYGFLAYLGSNYNELYENTARNNSVGIASAYANSSKFSGNRAYWNEYGMVLLASQGNTFTGNEAYNNTEHGLLINSSSSAALPNNFYLEAYYDNTDNGAMATNSSYFSFYAAKFFRNGGAGAYIHNSTAFNLAADASGAFYCYENHGLGAIHIKDSQNFSITPAFAPANEVYVYLNDKTGIYLENSSRGTIGQTMANGYVHTYENGRLGLYAYGPVAANTYYNVKFLNSHDNTNSGASFSNQSLNNISNSNFWNNGEEGLGLQNSDWNKVWDNNAYNNSENGYMLYSSERNNFTSNLGHNNSQNGLFIDTCPATAATQNTFTSDEYYNNSQNGINASTSSYFNIYSAHLYNNTMDGFYSFASSSFTIYSSHMYNNTLYGAEVISGSGNVLNQSVFYNNAYDFFIYNPGGGPPVSYSMDNCSFLNPSGTLENYTRLSMFDSVESSTSYTINWTQNSSPLPGEAPYEYMVPRFSFLQKWVNISIQAGVPSIDTAIWHWFDSEATGIYDEEKFELWKYNSTNNWTLLNTSPDISANTLSYYNFNPASDYGILQLNGSECMLINESGEYTLENNLIGAPIDVTEGADVAWACIKIKTHNVLLDCNGYNITNNGTSNAAGIISVPYLVLPIDKNVTIMNCPGVSGYESGIYIFDRYHEVYNSTSFNNTNGFYIHLNATNTTMENNTAYNNSNGFHIKDTSYANITNCTASNGTVGFRLDNASNNTLLGNRMYSNNEIGLIVSLLSNDNQVENNSIYLNGLEGASIVSSTGNVFQGNAVYDNKLNGIYMKDSTATVSTLNRFIRDSYYNNSMSGANMTNSDYFQFEGTNFTNNTIHGAYAYDSSNFKFTVAEEGGSFVSQENKQGSGIHIENSDTFSITPTNSGILGYVHIRDNKLDGITLYNSTRGTAGYSTLRAYVYSNDRNGIYINNPVGSYNSNHTLLAMRLYENLQSGANISNAHQTRINGTASYRNAWNGALLQGSSNCNLTNITVHGNGIYGLEAVSSDDLNSTLAHFYNNSGNDLMLRVTGTPVQVDFEKLYIDNPYGTYENYTNLSISDSIDAVTGYTINWTAVTRPLPGFAPYTEFPPRFSFLQKWVNISKYAGTTVIDEVVWHWDDSEATGIYDDSKFELWKYNDTHKWTLLNSSPDTGANTLSWYAFNPASDYGILQFNGTECMVINESGDYQLLNNITGAPIPISTEDTDADWACIVVSASDVAFDCNGYNITNNGTADAAGIFINGTAAINRTNVTIQNCPQVSLYKVGVYTHRTSNDTVKNTTSANSSANGFKAYGTDDSLFYNNTAYDNDYGIELSHSENNTVEGGEFYLSDWEAILLERSAYNNVTGNLAYNARNGAYIWHSSNNTVSGNQFYLNEKNGIYIERNSTYNNFSDNLIYNNTEHGVYIYNTDSPSHHNRFTGDKSYNNTLSGFYIYYANSTWLEGAESMENKEYGIYVRFSYYHNFTGNSIYNNSFDGINIGYPSGNNTLSANMVFLNGRNGILITDSRYNNFTDNWAYNNTRNGIALLTGGDSTPDWNTFIRDRAYNNSNSGFNISYADSTRMESVKSMDNGLNGIYLEYSENCMIINNSPSDASEVYNNSRNGMLIEWSDNLTIAGSQVYLNDYSGISIQSASYHNLTGNLIYNNTLDGIYTYYSHNSAFANNEIYNNKNGIYVYQCLDNNFTDDLIYNNSWNGVYLNSVDDPNTGHLFTNEQLYNNTLCGLNSSSSGFNMAGGTLMDNGIDGAYVEYGGSFSFYPSASTNSFYSGSNGRAGIYVYDSEDFEITPRRADGAYGYLNISGNGQDGVAMLESTNGTVGSVSPSAAGHTKIGYNARNGIYVFHASPINAYHTFSNVESHENGLSGINMTQARRSAINSSSLHDNGADGAYISACTSSNFTGNEIFGNTRYGLYAPDSSAFNATENHFYNNSLQALRLLDSAIGSTVYFTGLYIDNPYGNYENYTNLSLADYLEGESYTINWTAVTRPLPDYRFSFREKWVNISQYSGTSSIGEAVWHWNDAEAAGIYNDSKFELWKYNESAGWTLLNDTPDISANTLGWYAFNPASDYGILQFNGSECMEITASGEYQLINNLIGAPIPIFPDLGEANWACIVVSADDVVFDCNGYNITNNGTALAAGMYINGTFSTDRKNVTLRNCPSVSSYEVGAFQHYSENDTWMNITVQNSSGSGFRAYNTAHSLFQNNTAYNASGTGFSIYGAFNCTFTHNKAYNNSGHGAWINTGSQTSFISEEHYNNGQSGLYLAAATSNIISGGQFYLNGEDGTTVTSNSDYNRLTNNSAYNNSQYGFHLSTSSYNNLTNNTAFYESSGFYLEVAANSNRLTNNSAYNNSLHGFHLSSSDYNILTTNSAYNNSQHGFSVFSSTYNGLSGNNAFNNTIHGILLSSASNYNNLTSNLAYGNPQNGIYLSSSERNRLINNTAYENRRSGFYMDLGSNHNNITNCTAYSNTLTGITIDSGNGNIIDPSYFYNNPVGINISGSTGTIIDDSYIYNNTYGMFIELSNNTLINRSSIYNNSDTGIYQQNSNYTNSTNTNVTNNTVEGIHLDAGSQNNDVYNNYVCFNGLDINNESAYTSGTIDTCDTFTGWSENNHPGCTYACTEIWHVLYGNMSGKIVLAENNSDVFEREWDAIGYNVYAVNTNRSASVVWPSLLALGRDTSIAVSTNDFTDLDTVLAITTYPDNVEAVFSTDGTNPKETIDREIYKTLVSYVPVSNSTLTNAFLTGILWDSSQGGTQFNPSDNQDVVFVAPVNASQNGTYGTYDYEIRLPAPLATYKGGDTVDIYLELR